MMQSNDIFFSFNEQMHNKFQQSKVWMSNPKHFKNVKISSSAAMKMISHSLDGVNKGLSNGGKPVEVMGLLIGRALYDAPDTFVVMDAFPLPIEGAETRVLADDDDVINFMIRLSETLEQTRQEKFMGWYHSHPFDVQNDSHCFLSTTDIATQLQWQRAEDPNGNPWLAIVIDPLRSLAKNKPEIGAYRVYPPEYTAPLNETPDGKIVTDDSRVRKWGAAWNRYYSLDITYLMSSLSCDIMSTIQKKYMWMNTLISKSIISENEYIDNIPDRIIDMSNTIQSKLLKSNTIGNITTTSSTTTAITGSGLNNTSISGNNSNNNNNNNNNNNIGGNVTNNISGSSNLGIGINSGNSNSNINISTTGMNINNNNSNNISIDSGIGNDNYDIYFNMTNISNATSGLSSSTTTSSTSTNSSSSTTTITSSSQSKDDQSQQQQQQQQQQQKQGQSFESELIGIEQCIGQTTHIVQSILFSSSTS